MNQERVNAKREKLIAAQENILSLCEKIAKVKTVTEASAEALRESSARFLMALEDFEGAVEMMKKNERGKE